MHKQPNLNWLSKITGAQKGGELNKANVNGQLARTLDAAKSVSSGLSSGQLIGGSFEKKVNSEHKAIVFVAPILFELGITVPRMPSPKEVPRVD